MKIALLFLVIAFATAFPIHDVLIANNIPITNKTSSIINSTKFITRTLLTTTDDSDGDSDGDSNNLEENSDILEQNDNELEDDDTQLEEVEVKNSNNEELLEKPQVVEITPHHQKLTENLQIYHNHTTTHLSKLETKIIAMLKKTRRVQKEEELSNKKNYVNQKKILDKKNLQQQKYQQKLVILHQQIVALNNTIINFWNDIHIDTTYLQKLELLKPKFIGSIDKVNGEMDVLNKYITDNIIEGDDKKDMLSMMFNIKNTTHYSSNDLANAFLHHYEKYKNQLGKDTSSYKINIQKLHELITNYNLYETKIHDTDYSKIVNIVKKLKHVYRLSKENTQLLDELIFKIISILKTRSCSAKTFTTPNKECSLDLLKSHIANKLI
jgi:hypothetical protein